jgi:hypothetical protein
MSDDLRALRRDLRPLTNAFRGGRLIIGLLVVLFLGIFLLGFIIEAFRGPAKQLPTPAEKAQHERRAH